MTKSVCDPQVIGLRWCDDEDAAVFSRWEKKERPYPWTENQFLMRVNKVFFGTLVWECETGLVGFAAVQLIEGEAYLQNVMINEHYRHRGLGTVLLDKVFYWCRRSGAKSLWLDVDTDNIPALHLYERSGFKKMQVRSHAYPRGEAAASMKRFLGAYKE